MAFDGWYVFPISYVVQPVLTHGIGCLDSITENHFFSLSCLLYPHVRATPNYTENPYFDRAWPQKLYLSPTSPLIPELDFPPNFSIENTPLVLFRRVDLLLNQEDLETLYQNTFRTEAEDEDPAAANATKSLFSEESTWSLSPSEYMPILLSSPPEGNFGTLVVSTGGHWTTTLMSAFRDEEAGDEAGYGIENVKAFFKVAMRTWAGQVQDAIDEYRRNGGTRPKQAVVRAYLPGHEDCHNHREPWKEIQPYENRWYNWPWIQDYNAIFKVGVIHTIPWVDIGRRTDGLVHGIRTFSRHPNSRTFSTFPLTVRDVSGPTQCVSLQPPRDLRSQSLFSIPRAIACTSCPAWAFWKDGHITFGTMSLGRFPDGFDNKKMARSII